MKTQKIIRTSSVGRFEVLIVEEEDKKYNVVLKRSGITIKGHNGCFGIKSANYWAENLKTIAMKLDILLNMESNQFIKEWINEILGIKQEETK